MNIFIILTVKAMVALWHQCWHVRLLCGNCNHSMSIWGIHRRTIKPHKQIRVKHRYRYNLTVTRVLLVTLECLIENYQKKKKKNK